MKKIPFVEYDPNLDDYAKNHRNPFPKQMASAIASIEKHEASMKSYISKRTERLKLLRSPLQNELLNLYSFDPTEAQMQQLKIFMAQLFAEKLQETKAEKQAEMVA